MFTKQSFWLPDRFCHSCLFVYLYVINYLITKRDLKREDVPKFFCLSLYPIYIYVYIYIYIYYLVRIKTKKKAKKLRFIFFWDLRDLSKLLTTFKYQHVWNLHIKDLIAFAGRGMNEKIYWNIWHLTYSFHRQILKISRSRLFSYSTNTKLETIENFLSLMRSGSIPTIS